MAKYRVLVGIDYLDRRAEVDEMVDDVPEQSIDWLIECGAIELVDEAAVPDNIDANLPPIATSPLATPPPAVPNAEQLAVVNDVAAPPTPLVREGV